MSILIQNLTQNPGYMKNRKGPRPSNVMLATLKSKPEESDIQVSPGEIVDLTIYGEEKVKQNAEINMYIKRGLLKFLYQYPTQTTEEKQKTAETVKKNDVQVRLDNINGMDSLSELQDITEDDSLPMSVKFAALKRLQELEGDVEKAPEITDGSNEIIQ